MLCSGENPVLRIVGVEKIQWSGGIFEVAPREYCVLSFRIRGSTVIRSGGQTYHIGTNDILYLPQNMGYTAEYTATEMISIHFVTGEDDRQIELYSFENGDPLFKLFLNAHALWEKKEPGYAVYGMAQLYTILGALLEKETKTVLPQHFLKAVSFINSHYRNNAIGVDRICAEAGIGATVFRQLFRKHYQKTPMEYITDLRLEYARNLISGGVPIETAAYESGFNDPKYFARVVKKRLGCTPRALKSYGK